jgi:hypothetical protein
MNNTLDSISDANTAYNKALLTNVSENKCGKPNSTVETEIVGKKSSFFFFFFFLFFKIFNVYLERKGVGVF